MQNGESKKRPTMMTRFMPFRTPYSRYLAMGEKNSDVNFNSEADKSARVSVIIPVFNEAKTLPMVLSEVSQLPFQTEIICVTNGCQDESSQIAREYGARVLDFPEPLGHDIGRALGSKELCADVYLFTDADIVVSAADLAVFVHAVLGGVDIALNDYSGILRTEMIFHPVNICKYFLNLTLRYGKLGPSSLTAIPHALSRKAVKAIGSDSLSKPPLALVKAVLNGLNIQPVHFVEVSAVNKHSDKDLTELIIGDHLEALEYLSSQLGGRAWFPDNIRRRDQINK
jgi:hypothetical protein